tara:strand:- start:1139 stop:1456 length:318 start_codon:yes stop_codon:yes gene_type:complete
MLYCAKRFVAGAFRLLAAPPVLRLAPGCPRWLGSRGAVRLWCRRSVPLLAARGVTREAELGAKVAEQWLSLSDAAHAKFDRDADAATARGLAAARGNTQSVQRRR